MRALLDVALTHPQHGQIFVDVSVVDAAFTNAPRDHWWALARRERAKHNRYPGNGLYPFVLDARGRWGREADAFVRTILNMIPQEQHSRAIQRCRSLVSRALQMAVADALLSASYAPGDANRGRAQRPRIWRRG